MSSTDRFREKHSVMSTASKLYIYYYITPQIIHVHRKIGYVIKSGTQKNYEGEQRLMLNEPVFN